MRLSPKQIAAVVILSCVLSLAWVGTALAAPPWPDAPNTWWVATYGVTDTRVGTVAEGSIDGTFGPTRAVTRAQFAKMAVSGFALDPKDPPVATFIDVAKGTTFYVFVEGAYAARLINGYPVPSGASFLPGGVISRQQAYSIVARYLAGLEKAASGSIVGQGGASFETLDAWFGFGGGSSYLSGFSDAGTVDAAHQAATAYLVKWGVVLGAGGLLTPRATLNRAQAAVLVLRAKDVVAQVAPTPGAPTNVAVTPAGPSQNATPVISGKSPTGTTVLVYDAFGGAETSLATVTADAAGSFSYKVTEASHLAEGTHHFFARARSGAGMLSLSSNSVEYVLDITAPTGSITKPAPVPSGTYDRAVNSRKFAFEATAADTLSGVASVAFQYAVAPGTGSTPSWHDIGEPWTPAGAAPNPCAAQWPSTGPERYGLGEGRYVIRIVVTDKAGNALATAPFSVTVDVGAPTAVISPDPQEGAGGVFYTESHKPLFTATAADSSAGGLIVSGMEGGKVSFMYAPWRTDYDSWSDLSVLAEDGTSPYAYLWPSGALSGGLAEGRYLFAAQATDRAGNSNPLLVDDPVNVGARIYDPGATRQVVIDDKPPVITFVLPQAGGYVLEGWVFTVVWTLVDVSPPDTVSVAFRLSPWHPWEILDDAVPIGVLTATGWEGSYKWLIPSVTADETGAQLRITATDKCGPVLGTAAQHTTAKVSDSFVIKNQ